MQNLQSAWKNIQICCVFLPQNNSKHFNRKSTIRNFNNHKAKRKENISYYEIYSMLNNISLIINFKIEATAVDAFVITIVSIRRKKLSSIKRKWS